MCAYFDSSQPPLPVLRRGGSIFGAYMATSNAQQNAEDNKLQV